MGELSRFIVAIFLPSIVLYSWNLIMWIYYPSEELIYFDFTVFATIFLYIIFYSLSVFMSEYKIVKKRKRIIKKVKTKKVKTVKKKK